MATIEFAPPRGLEPWMGRALLRELVDQDTVVAWFSEMIAQEAMVITTDGDQHTLEPGPQRDRVSAADQKHVAQLFRNEPSIELGTYDATFAGTWRSVFQEQQDFIRDSGWWSSTTGRASSIASGVLGALIVIGLLFAVNIVNFATDGLGILTSPWLAIVLGIAAPVLRRAARLLGDGAVAHRHRVGARAADRVVPSLPRGQRGQARAMGVGQRTAARVQRLGGGPRCRRRVGTGDPGEQHPRTAGRAQRAAPRALAGVFDGQHQHATVVDGDEQRVQWVQRRWRGRRRRWQLRLVVRRRRDQGLETGADGHRIRR